MAFLAVQFEDEVRRNPYSAKTWWNYVQTMVEEAPIDRFEVYERAVTHLPRSYKLWHAYLNDRTIHLRGKSITSKKYMLLIDAFERALVFMNKMPRIWLDYCKVMMSLKRTTATRRVFDRALEALPITQHQEVWILYIDWVHSLGVPETAIRVYRRYLMFDPAYREQYVAYLLEIEQFEEAARQLVTILNEPTFSSPSGQTQHQMWLQLCDICCKHPASVAQTVKVEDIIRSGISKFSDEIARLWTSLADYYIRLGQFEKARDIFEEALGSVSTVRDFTIIFDSYIKVEESVLTAKMRMLDSADNEDDEEEGLTAEEKAEEMVDVSLRLARLEFLMEQRPLLVNAVTLRQSPHSVKDWIKRIKLFKDDDQRVLLTVAEAIQTIHPKLALGKLALLYKIWAGVYEKRGDLVNARVVFERAAYVNYKSPEETAEVWCAYAEMEMRADCYVEAWAVMQRAVQDSSVHAKKKVFAPAPTSISSTGSAGDATTSSFHSIDRLVKSTMAWGLYLDLEEALGTPQTVRAAYDRCMELKVITPHMLLHYAAYLEQQHHFEEAFTVYERGLELFQFPQVKVLFAVYLDKFVERYQGSKLERLRDLLETCLSRVPPADAAEYFLRYAKLEEQFGLVRHVMAILERAVLVVPDRQRLDMYRLYAKKVEQHYGLVKARSVYESALKKLSDADSVLCCVEYAGMERKLNEIDRARAIFVYGSQFADPRREGEYYRQWREFEEACGNEETFREMLRVQRSVQAAFAQVSYVASEMVSAAAAPASGSALANKAVAGLATTMDVMAQQAEANALEEAAAAAAGKRKFVPATAVPSTTVDEADEPPSKAPRNDEELDI